jgi:hypothetical protein
MTTECCGEYLRLAADTAFEGAEALIDRNQFYNSGPRVHKELERRSNLGEGIENLVQRTKRDLAGHNSRCEYNVRKYVVRLQIQDTADIEVHVVEVDPKIVLADGCKKIDQFEWYHASRVVLAQDKFLSDKPLPHADCEILVLAAAYQWQLCSEISFRDEVIRVSCLKGEPKS